MNEIDNIFGRKLKKIKGFEFNQEVVDVFDDMVSRSVPFYHEIHFIIRDILEKSTFKKGRIYDLGCSTGTTITLMDQHLKKTGREAQFIGVDNSSPMLKRCDQKLKKNKVSNYELICSNIEDLKLNPSNIIIMNYTLQFIPTAKRLEILNNIYKSLKTNGVFILSEKIKSQNTTVNKLMTDLYYDFKKRNGYSELEISQKREALENVLVPLTPKNQIANLKKAGFKKCEVLFRWYNFACFIGIK